MIEEPEVVSLYDTTGNSRTGSRSKLEVVSLHDTTGNSSVVEIDNESDGEVGVASKKNTSK